jgi:hypothetical protein
VGVSEVRYLPYQIYIGEELSLLSQASNASISNLAFASASPHQANEPSKEKSALPISEKIPPPTSVSLQCHEAYEAHNQPFLQAVLLAT